MIAAAIQRHLADFLQHIVFRNGRLCAGFIAHFRSPHGLNKAAILCRHHIAKNLARPVRRQWRNGIGVVYQAQDNRQRRDPQIRLQLVFNRYADFQAGFPAADAPVIAREKPQNRNNDDGPNSGDNHIRHLHWSASKHFLWQPSCQLRKQRQQPQHDQLNQHKRYSAFVNLRSFDSRRCDAAQIEQRETKGRGEEAGLQIYFTYVS